ncbi:MAG TPA: dihydrofolate reductase [Bacillota bacterium]|nr:dihydrofolate reductase [Bacillota bacterium]
MISIVVAMSQNRVIGKNNQLPWHLPADLKYFKRVTMEHPILMGRKTFESIGKPLPGRTNVILTRQQDYQPEGCVVIHTVEDALKLASNEELCVIGGAEIIREFLPFTDRLYLTLIEQDVEGDTYMPPLDLSAWQEVSYEKGITDEKNPYPFAFYVYEKTDRD